MFKAKIETVRIKFREKVGPELMPYVDSGFSRKIRNHSAMVQKRLNGKLDNLSKRQDGTLRNDSQSIVVIVECGVRPKSVYDVLSLGPKSPVRQKFNEMHFVADVDKIKGKLRKNNTEVEKFCAIEASDK